MALIKLKPACKDYLWGGDRLIREYHKPYEGDRLAETWELSCHSDGPSVIAEGEGMGLTLQEYIDREGKEILGENCSKFADFPILIKMIDAKDDLSIQVHPDNDYALEHEGQYGKTEMWYVMDCEEGAFLYYGFQVPVDQREFAERIQNNTLTDVLRKVYVKKGDVLFIEARTIHAIGKNIMVAEIQQNSNVTYRVYDYGRKGADGKCRDLHIEKALAVTNTDPILKEKSFSPHIAKCDYFTVDKIYLDGSSMKRLNGYAGKESFVHLLVIEGEGAVWSGSQVLSLAKGDSVFIPAGSGEFEITGELEVLMTRV